VKKVDEATLIAGFDATEKVDEKNVKEEDRGGDCEEFWLLMLLVGGVGEIS